MTPGCQLAEVQRSVGVLDLSVGEGLEGGGRFVADGEEGTETQ